MIERRDRLRAEVEHLDQKIMLLREWEAEEKEKARKATAKRDEA